MLLQLVFLTLLPAFTNALVGIDWSVSGGPSSGLTDVGFPMNMKNASHKSGYFYAMEFAFVGVDPGAIEPGRGTAVTDPGLGTAEPGLGADDPGLVVPTGFGCGVDVAGGRSAVDGADAAGVGIGA